MKEKINKENRAKRMNLKKVKTRKKKEIEHEGWLGKISFIKRNWRKGIKEKKSQTEKSQNEDRSRRATRDN